jgi:hypothetical protein
MFLEEATAGAREDRRTSDATGGVGEARDLRPSFAAFSDPNDNTWLFQEITTRLP